MHSKQLHARPLFHPRYFKGHNVTQMRQGKMVRSILVRGYDGLRQSRDLGGNSGNTRQVAATLELALAVCLFILG